MHQTLKIIVVLIAVLFAQFSFAGLQEGVDAYPIHSVAKGKESLCTDNETILLACVTKSKFISVCASKTFSATTGYIQYRVEKNGKIEFEFPKEKASPSKEFTLEAIGGGKYYSGSTTLGFTNGEYLYEIQHDKDEDNFSVIVSHKQEVISTLACSGGVIDHWETLENSNLPESGSKLKKR